ncbi:MAG: 4-hydroxythreonine-4-phosphate dehydrogenase PdxA [Balneolaceae bacterium]
MIAISMGDYNGIGPEVSLKSLNKIDLSLSTPVWIGSTHVFEQIRNQVKLKHPYEYIRSEDELKTGQVNVLEVDRAVEPMIVAGRLSAEAGRLSMISVEKGIDLCLSNLCNALVTAPISKEAISKAGYTVPGHTEFLSEKTNTKSVMMILTSDVLRVGLSTIHIPVRNISKWITADRLLDQIIILHNSLVNDFGLSDPRIAVLGLNPHAGDGGVIGDEEVLYIKPAIQAANDHNYRVKGPYPADGYFASGSYKNFDMTLAMYHDQGLIPFKTLSFGKGVNFTAGLPIIRTSPDHGTAFDIAGKNCADENSFIEAYRLAVNMVNNRSILSSKIEK